MEEIPNFDDEYQRRDVIESNTNEETNENWDYNTEVNDETQRPGSNNSETTVNDEEPDNNSPKSPVTNDRSDNQGQSLRHDIHVFFLTLSCRNRLHHSIPDSPLTCGFWKALDRPDPLLNNIT
ncbi:unnamed protein product [Lactuca virosa]|uniref:Uncharacterized protein n=1 Tax=Lactuca virosa TaxID=75947 RepID=A0AAU9M1J1_9ASTR|nr:unnamed protein product [Lactuca virosa]